jgi:hypothetical protein
MPNLLFYALERSTELVAALGVVAVVLLWRQKRIVPAADIFWPYKIITTTLITILMGAIAILRIVEQYSGPTIYMTSLSTGIYSFILFWMIAESWLRSK